MGFFLEVGDFLATTCVGVVIDSIDVQKDYDFPLGSKAQGDLDLFAVDCGSEGQEILHLLNTLNPRGIHMADPTNAGAYIAQARRFMKLWGTLPHQATLGYVAECLIASMNEDAGLGRRKR